MTAKMNAVGCVFCDKIGNVSSLNQHIRSYLDASRTGRQCRGSEHHQIEIVQAFYSLTAQRQTDFIQATPADRLAVVTAFASNITKHIKSDVEADKWRKRDFYPRRATWWTRQITIVLDMYRASGRMPQLLSAHVKNIVDMSITDSLLDVDDDDDENDDDEPGLASLVPGRLNAGRSQLLAMAGASGSFMPAPQTDLTMQYTGSQRGNRLGMDNTIVNKPMRKWINNLSPPDSDTVSEPKIQVRKRANPTFHNAREGSISLSTEYVTISDEEQDDVNDEEGMRMTPPPDTRTSKRGKTMATGRAAASTLPGSRTAAAAAKDVRSVSDGAAISSRTTLTNARGPEPDGMAPFVVLRVIGLTNTVQTIPIAYGTTLDQALALAVAYAPRIVRDNNIPVRFYGDPGSAYVGDWPEWRWDEIMEAAMSQKVELLLRLIMVE